MSQRWIARQRQGEVLRVEGNRRLREYCAVRGIPMFQGGILVVARSEAETLTLAELKRRADVNGVEVRLVDAIKIPHPSSGQSPPKSSSTRSTVG